MSAGRANLLFDQIEVVKQPFIRRRHLPFGSDGCQHQVVSVQQYGFILLQAVEKMIGSVASFDLLRRRQCLGVLL
jgi:hypothetical protein